MKNVKPKEIEQDQEVTIHAYKIHDTYGNKKWSKEFSKKMNDEFTQEYLEYCNEYD